MDSLVLKSIMDNLDCVIASNKETLESLRRISPGTNAVYLVPVGADIRDVILSLIDANESLTSVRETIGSEYYASTASEVQWPESDCPYAE